MSAAAATDSWPRPIKSTTLSTVWQWGTSSNRLLFLDQLFWGKAIVSGSFTDRYWYYSMNQLTWNLYKIFHGEWMKTICRVEITTGKGNQTWQWISRVVFNYFVCNYIGRYAYGCISVSICICISDTNVYTYRENNIYIYVSESICIWICTCIHLGIPKSTFCVYPYLYMHIRIHIHICICNAAYASLNMHTYFIPIYIYIYVNTYMYTYFHIYICIYIYIYINICISIYIYMHIYFSASLHGHCRTPWSRLVPWSSKDSIPAERAGD